MRVLLETSFLLRRVEELCRWNPRRLRGFGLFLVLGVEMKERKREGESKTLSDSFFLLFVLRTRRRQTLVKLLPERVAGGILGLEVASWCRRSGVGGREGKRRTKAKGKRRQTERDEGKAEKKKGHVETSPWFGTSAVQGWGRRGELKGSTVP